MKILVTGGSGSLGAALRAELPATYLGRSELDVRDGLAVERAVREHDPSIIVHAAAITDHQTKDVAGLIETNIVGTSYIASAANIWGATLVYLSTHYVYPGERGNYSESDQERPIGAYAWSKYAGERFVGGVASHLIVRGSWYTDARVKQWSNAVVEDSYSSRIHVTEAARRIALLIKAGVRGTFNIGGPRRSFVEIVDGYGLEYKTITRGELNKSLPYDFPPDTSVSTAKYDALVSA